MCMYTTKNGVRIKKPGEVPMRRDRDLRSVLEHKRQEAAGVYSPSLDIRRRPSEPEHTPVPSTVRLPGTSRLPGLIIYVREHVESNISDFFKSNEFIGPQNIANKALEGMSFFLISSSDQLFGLFEVTGLNVRPATSKEEPECEVSYRVVDQYPFTLNAAESGFAFEAGTVMRSLTQAEVTELVRRFKMKQADYDERRRLSSEREQEQRLPQVVFPPPPPPPPPPAPRLISGFAYGYHEKDAAPADLGLPPDWMVGDGFHQVSPNPQGPRSMGVPIDTVPYPTSREPPMSVNGGQRVNLENGFRPYQRVHERYPVPVNESTAKAMFEANDHPRHGYHGPYQRGDAEQQAVPSSRQHPRQHPSQNGTAKKNHTPKQKLSRPPPPDFIKPKKKKFVAAEEPPRRSVFDRVSHGFVDLRSSSAGLSESLESRLNRPLGEPHVSSRITRPHESCYKYFQTPPKKQKLAAAQQHAHALEKVAQQHVRYKLVKQRETVVEEPMVDAVELQVPEKNWDFKRRSASNVASAADAAVATAAALSEDSNARKRRFKRPDLGLPNVEVKQ